MGTSFGMSETGLHHNFILVNADTDSIMICNPDGSPIPTERRKELLDELNSLLPEKIRFEDDGYFDSVCVVKAKNYALKTGEKLKIKGSALKMTYKEPALQEFGRRLLDIMLDELGYKNERVVELYNDYVKEIFNLTDIARWSSKKTITESVLNPERTNEAKINDAIKDLNVSMGDKVRIYFTSYGTIKTVDQWSSDHDVDKLLEKLFKTVKVFESVLDISKFPNYKLKKNKLLISQII